MSKGKVLCMPLKGKVVPITDVPDSVFSEKMMAMDVPSFQKMEKNMHQTTV